MIGDCTLCGGRVGQEVDEDRGPVEVCDRCQMAQPPVPVYAGIRQAVRESRRRRLLGPSCLGRRHSRCTAQLCECNCGHPGRSNDAGATA